MGNENPQGLLPRMGNENPQGLLPRMGNENPQGLLPRMGHTADIIGDYLYVFGGFDLNSVMYNFSRLSMLSGVWEDVEVDKKSTATPAGQLLTFSLQI